MRTIETPAAGHPATSELGTSAEAPGRLVSAPDGVIIIAGRRYLTAAALAQLFGICGRTLHRWHDQRVGPPKIKIGNKTLYDEAKLTDWLATHETGPLPDRRRRSTRAA